MDEIGDIDCIHFLQICKYLDLRPVLYVSDVQVKHEPSEWSRGDPEQTNAPVMESSKAQSMSELIGMFRGLKR